MAFFKWNKTQEPLNKETKKKIDVMVDIVRQNFNRYRKELDQWQLARDLRLDVDHPTTYDMQELYADVMVDTHLRALVENRILRIVNREFVIRTADGEVDEEKTKVIAMPWFTDVIRYVMESIFFGYNLIWIKDAAPGEIKEVCIVPREHVIPEKGFIINHVRDYDDGFPYAEMPNHLLYAQLYDSVGLLETAAPLTVLKRHSWGSWDEFEMMFGIPMRIAKIAGASTQKKREASKWLQEMGRSASGVFELGDEIEIVSNNQTDSYQVFLEKISTVNSELSKLINGQTMTTDDGSSRSQADVHLKTQNEITRADEREVLHWLNLVLKPALQFHGYKIGPEDRFDIFKQSSPEDRIKIDIPLLQNGFRLSEDYIEKTYGVELDKTEAKDPKKPNGPDKEVEDFFS